jgi:hypothetical protein
VTACATRSPSLSSSDGDSMAELEQAFADRHRGQASNLAAATATHRDDRERVERALAALARSGHAFNSNDVEALALTDGGGDLNNRNVISSLMGG